MSGFTDYAAKETANETAIADGLTKLAAGVLALDQMILNAQSAPTQAQLDALLAQSNANVALVGTISTAPPVPPTPPAA